jgi:hypothetical protein
MFRSLRLQLGAIVFGFVLLVAGSVAATYLTLQEHAGDTAVINLAGRQRMLTVHDEDEKLFEATGAAPADDAFPQPAT